MVYSFSLIYFLIFANHLLISIINASSSVDDKMLIAFMKGHHEMQISKYSIQKYETHLSIVHFMRKNWQCDKIGNDFEEYERTECKKYRKNLDILYEYLSREYAKIPTVKPKFIFKKGTFEIEGSIIYVVNCLVKISQFYFIKSVGQEYEYKLNKLFINCFNPKLENEERLKNEQELPINELILQLAIETANEWQTNESLDGIIRQKFKKNLEGMLKKANEDNTEWRAKEINKNKHKIIVDSKFDDQLKKWTKDALISEYVKGLAAKSEKFLKMAKEYANFLHRNNENKNFFRYYDVHMNNFGLYEIEKMQEHLTQKFEAHLGVMYLMRKNCQCDKIGKEFNENELKICRKHRKHLYILYEYLFRLYTEGTSAELANKFQAVKPVFTYSDFNEELTSVIKTLNKTSKYFWPKDFIFSEGLIDPQNIVFYGTSFCDNKHTLDIHVFPMDPFNRLYEDQSDTDKYPPQQQIVQRIGGKAGKKAIKIVPMPMITVTCYRGKDKFKYLDDFFERWQSAAKIDRIDLFMGKAYLNYFLWHDANNETWEIDEEKMLNIFGTELQKVAKQLNTRSQFAMTVLPELYEFCCPSDLAEYDDDLANCIGHEVANPVEFIGDELSIIRPPPSPQLRYETRRKGKNSKSKQKGNNK